MTQAGAAQGAPGSFSLLGGPLHQLGRRLGLVRGAANTTLLGLVLGLVAWSVLVLLAVLDGFGHKLFALSLVGAHVRLLVVIPLFFVCESLLDPRQATFVGMIVRAGIVRGDAVPSLESQVARIRRWSDSWVPDAVCFLAAVLVPAASAQLHLPGTTGAFDPGGVAAGSRTFWWYWIVCLPLFRFLALRWAWQLGLWSHFLWRVSRMELDLVPTHPDGAAGLGYLEVVHVHFLPMAIAFSALQAASLAEELVVGKIAFESIYPAVAVSMGVSLALFVGPLCVFAPRLWTCRVKGLSDYMAFASSYVTGFDRKWRAADAPPREDLLGTPDLQSLADLGNSMGVVSRMRWLPASERLATGLAINAVLPFLPLLLLKYPIAELVQKFISRALGL